MAQVLENNVMGVLSGAVDAVTKTLPLVTLAGWPVLANGDHCLATLVGLNQNGIEAAWEIVKVTGRVGSSLTVERGQEGIAARAWPAGTVLQMRLTAGSVATPSLVEAVRLALLQMMAADRTQVDGLLGAKVDKNGAKVLSDNNYTNDERVKLANIQALATKNLPDATLLERSNQTGGFHGFGLMSDMRDGTSLPASSPPSAFFGKGSFIGLADAAQIGLALPAASYGTFQCHGHWTDGSAGWGVSRSFVTLFGKHYDSFAVDTNTWSPWFETSVSTAIITAPSLKEFFQAMWARGSGYYRNDAPATAVPQYSAGFFSKTADTWTFVCAHYASGAPVFFSGGYPDIAAGTWFKFTFGTAASRNAQTTVNDNSQGALMLVGAFGNGSINPVSGMNLSNFGQFPSGRSTYYLNDAFNGPYPGFYGYLEVDKVDDSYIRQTVVGVENGIVHTRIRAAGVIKPWVIDIDSVTAVGEIVNGAIIELGGNANGDYVKFADGTLICRYKINGVSPANPSSVANIFRSNSISWTYPALFSAAPCVSHSETSGIGLCWTGLGVVATTTAITSVSLYSMTQGGLAEIGLTAIGRWK